MAIYQRQSNKKNTLVSQSARAPMHLSDLFDAPQCICIAKAFTFGLRLVIHILMQSGRPVCHNLLYA